MADLHIQNETLDQAITDMVQATQAMTNNLQDLIQGIGPMASTFTGQAATAWAQFQTVAQQADTNMQQDFGKGSQILQQMHDLHLDADKKGAARFGS